MERGYIFSFCACALAILNGDLSLSKSDIPQLGCPLGFSWGPQSTLRLDELTHSEDDHNVVRILPAKLTNAGILVKGWLWKLDELLADVKVTSDPAHLDPPEILWALLKILNQRGRHEIVDLIWKRVRRPRIDIGSLFKDRYQSRSGEA